MLKYIVPLLVALLLAVPCTARLDVLPENPRYFVDEGKPVALFGSGLWTIIPDGSIDIEDHNSWYAKYGANANRAALFSFCTRVGGDKGVAPWRRTGPGKSNDGRAKFDLTQPNPDFWERAHAYFASTEKHGIYVWLQIFGEPFVEGGKDRWFINPFNADNHINPIPGLPGGDGSGEAAFYDPDNAPLMAVQDGLVRRLLDETAQRYGHIVYEIGNEINMDSVTPKAAAWQQHWIDFFQAYEKEHGVRLLLANNTRRELMEQGGDGFDVINQNGILRLNIPRAEPQEVLRRVREGVAEDFQHFGRPIVNSRPCSDPDRVNYGDVASEEQARVLYWSYFMCGGHIVGFRTTEESWKAGLTAEHIIGNLRAFIDAVPLAGMKPRHDLVTGQALCLAQPGAAYAVYLPFDDTVTLTTGGSGPWAARWYDTKKGAWTDSEELSGDALRLEKRGKGNAVLVMRKAAE